MFFSTKIIPFPLHSLSLFQSSFYSTVPGAFLDVILIYLLLYGCISQDVEILLIFFKEFIYLFIYLLTYLFMRETETV